MGVTTASVDLDADGNDEWIIATGSEKELLAISFDAAGHQV